MADRKHWQPGRFPLQSDTFDRVPGRYSSVDASLYIIARVRHRVAKLGRYEVAANNLHRWVRIRVWFLDGQIKLPVHVSSTSEQEIFPGKKVTCAL